MLTAKEKEILTALEPQAADVGLEIVTVEIVGAKKAPTIRIYIDTPDGVGFDELSQAQEWINKIVDEIDPFPGAYNLEVSSPGIDRPLRTIEHFERFIGENAVITLQSPIEKRAKYTGVLAGVQGEKIMLQIDGHDEAIEIDFTNVKRARLKGTVHFS